MLSCIAPQQVKQLQASGVPLGDPMARLKRMTDVSGAPKAFVFGEDSARGHVGCCPPRSRA
jgi:hypothetical protein